MIRTALLAVLLSATFALAQETPLDTPQALAAHINTLTEPDLLAPGSYESARKDGSIFTFSGLKLQRRAQTASVERLVVREPVAMREGLRAAEISVENGAARYTASGEVAFTVGRLAFSRVTLRKRPDGTAGVSRLSDLGGVEVRDLKGFVPDAPRRLDLLRYEAKVSEAGKLEAASLAIEGLVLGAGIVRGVPRPIARILADLDPTDLDFSLDARNERLDVRLDADLFGAVDLSYALELLGWTDERAAQAFSGRADVWQQLPIARIDLELERGKSFDAVMDALAGALNRDRAALDKTITDAIGYGLGYAVGSHPRTEEIWRATIGFVGGSVGKLGLLFRPTPPITMAQAEAGARPEEMIDRLGFEFTTAPAAGKD